MVSPYARERDGSHQKIRLSFDPPVRGDGPAELPGDDRRIEPFSS
jgi:hypothetical protein